MVCLRGEVSDDSPFELFMNDEAIFIRSLSAVKLSRLAAGATTTAAPADELLLAAAETAADDGLRLDMPGSDVTGEVMLIP